MSASPFDEFQRAPDPFDEFQRATPPVGAVLKTAVQTNPDDMAEAVRLAKRYPAPVDSLYRNLPKVRFAAVADDAADQLATAKALSQYLASRPHVAGMAHDDIPKLKEIESNFAQTAPAAAAQAVLGISEGIWRTPDAAQRAVGYLASTVEKTGLPPYLNPIRGVQDVLQFISEGRLPVGPKLMAGTTDVADRISGAQEILTDRATFGNAFADVQTLAKNADQALATAVQTGNLEQVGQVLTDPNYWSAFMAQAVPSLYLAMKSGGSVAFMGWLEGMEQASNAAEFEKRTGIKVTDQEFTQAFAQTAIVNALLERYGLDKVLGAKGNGLKGLAKAMAAEGGTEGLQQINSNLAALLAYNQEQGLTEGVLASVMGGVASGGGVSAAQQGAQQVQALMERQQQQARAAAEDAGRLQQLLGAAGQSLLRERSPEDFRAYVQTLGDKPLYVDGEVLNQLPAEVLNQLPESVREQIADAAATGDTVEIPMADVLTIAPGTPLEQVLNEHARMDPFASSKAEVAAAQDVLKQEAERVIQQAADAQVAQQEFDTVKAMYAEQIAATGRYRPAVAEQMGTWIASFYTAYGSRVGMTPTQFQQRYPVRVAGVPSSAGQVIDQGQALTPEMKAWFDEPGPENTMVNEDGTPRVLYHGTTKANVKGMKALGEIRRSETGAMGPGIYLGDDRSVSEAYMPGKGGAMLEVYARGKYLDNAQWTEYIQAHGWKGAEAAAKADGWAGVHDQKFENAVVVWDAANIKVVENARPRESRDIFNQPGSAKFDAWFGDSKVVDAEGKPLVVYHGTVAGGFDVFRSNVRKGEQLGFGVHFAVDPGFAGLYASDPAVARKGKNPKVYATYLKAEKPLLADTVVVEGTPEFALAKKLAGGKLFTVKDESGKQTAYLQHAIDATSPQRAEKLIREAGYDAVRYESRVGTAGVGARVTAKSQSWVVFRPEQIKSATGNNGNFDPQNPSILEQRATRPLFDQAREENFRRWSNDAPLVTSADATTRQFKTGEKVVVEAFHGTKRPDRVGTKFLKKRATSGPMAYHTSDPTLASSYATGKQDTSLSMEDQDYSNWFKVKLPGERSATDFVRSWYRLDAATKDKIAALAPRVTFSEEQEADGGNKIVLGDESVTSGTGSYDYNLAATRTTWDRRGNPLKALVEDWLNSGNLFNDEQRFMQVLKLAGFPMQSVEYDSPHSEFPFVYKNYIAMQKPLVTSDVPQEVKDALNAAAKKDRSRAQAGGADAWDKNTRTLKEWVAAFNSEDNTYVWTSIPDKVTEVFKSLGYDGIIDWSGKGGGPAALVAPVYIPFEETQVKSALGNKGNFDPQNPSILEQSAYHGTPHRGIDKFTTDKIGTGEGFQAFGWGLYFTNKREIAEWYREKLTAEDATQAPRRFVKGVEVQPGTGGYFAARLVESSTLAAARKDVASWVKDADSWDAKRKADKGEQETLRVWQEALAVLNEATSKKDFTSKAAQGQLYEVELPDDENLLLWDKPLGQQPEKVRKALKDSGLAKELKDNLSDYSSPMDTRGKLLGENIYAYLQWKLGSDKAASERLRGLGVLGTNYPAGTIAGNKNSRARNYVVFSGDDVQIRSQFYQNAPTPRGTFNPRSLELVLNPNANLSTFFHETGHFFLEVMADIASQPNPPAQIVEDFGTFLKWAGITGDEDVGGADSGVPLGQQAEDADAVYQEIAADQEMIDALEVYMVYGDPPEGALNDKLVAYLRRLPPVPADSYLTFYRNQPRGVRAWGRGWASWTTNEDQTRFFGGRDFEVLKRKGAQGINLERLGEARGRITGDYHQYGSQAEWLLLNESVGLNQDGQPTPATPPLPKRRTPLETWNAMTLDQKRPYHERWAESIEQYVMEGKAPSVELQPLMRRFAAWLKSVYGSIKQFLAQRGVPVAGGEALNQSSAVQSDLFPGEFATKRTTVETSTVIDSKGTRAKGGNTNSKGQRVTATKQGLQRFWDWFAGSEATDDKGRPLVLYHSTNSDVTQFETNRETTNSYGILGEVTVRRAGIFLTPDLKFSQEYLRDGAGQNVMQVYAALKNPLDLRKGLAVADEQALEAAGVSTRYVHNVQNYWELFDSADDGTNAFVDGLKAAGYDGAIFHEDSPGGESEGGTTYVAFESTQVKSAIGNRGTFDANDPSLLSQDPAAPAGPQMALNDDIRRVMDRMLATDEQIAQANEVAGLVPDENADALANERLRKRSIADLKWAVKARDAVIAKLKKEARAIEKRIREEVTAEVNQMREVQAKDMLAKSQKENGGKLNDTERAIIADAFSYESVDAMLQAIDAFGSKADVIDGMTEQRMLEEHGDLIDERAMQAAANEAVHNEARARSLATELRTQAEMLNPRTDTGETTATGRRVTVNALVEAAKQFAANVVGKTSLRDLKAKAWQHTAAERRASKRWQEATAAGKTQDAVKAKQDQMLNHAAAKAAIDAQAEAREILDFFARVTKGNDETVVEKGRDADLVNAARAVLAAYGVQTPASKGAEAYLESLAKHDPETYNVVKPMVDAATQNAQPLEALTFDELQALHEEVQAIWFLAKRTRQMEVDGDLLDIDDVAQELYSRMEEIGIPDEVPGERGALTRGELLARQWLQQAPALLRRVEQWAEAKDGKFGGPFLRFIFQPVKDAADRYRTARLEYRKKFQSLVDNIAPMMTPGTIDAPELGYVFGRGHNGGGMAELLHAIAHTGNESNKRKLLLGRQWATELPDGTLDTSRWDAFIQRLANEGRLQREHFDFVQGVWDLLEETKPLAQKTHREVFGRYFAEVTADAFVDPFGVQRRGGYIPAQADPLLVQDADLRELLETENVAMSQAFPQTNRGFTKSRVEYNRPLKLDLRTLPQHIDKVLLFAHMEPAVRGVARVLRRPKVSQPLARIDPAAMGAMLKPWLNRSARQTVETPISADAGLNRMASAVRGRVGMALMFANVSNTLQQITGSLTASIKVKPGLMMRATAQFIANPKKFKQSVWDISPYMADRAANEVAVLSDTLDKILVNPSVWQSAEHFTRRHAYFLQTAFDNQMSPIIWSAAYNQALTDGVDERMAVRFADGVIRQTQGSTLPEDVSRIETGPAYARLFTQFVGYFNMMANTNATAIQQIAAEQGLRKGAGKAFYTLLLGLLAPIWVAEAIAHAMRGGPDDEDDDGWLDDWLAAVFGFGTIRGLLSGVPFLGAVGQSVVNRFNRQPADDKFSLSPTVSVLESAAGAPASVYKAIVEDKSKQRAVRDTAALITVLTGLPAMAVARPLGYAAGMADDRINPTGPADMARGLVTGTASPESRTP